MAESQRGVEYNAIVLTFWSISVICVLIRMYTRFFVVRSPYWDDYLLIFGLIVMTIGVATVPVQVKLGAGKHITEITNLQDAIEWGKYFYIAQLTYLISMCATKVSISILVLRLELPRAYNRVLYALITVITLFTLFFVFWITFQCKPVKEQWEQSGTGTCVSRTIFTNSVYALRAINAATDIMLVIVPTVAIMRLSNLNLDMKARIGASLTIGLGSIACVVTLVSFKFTKSYTETDDFLYAVIPLAICSSTENTIGVICASLAAFRPLLRKFFSEGGPFVRGSSYHKYGSSPSGSRVENLSALPGVASSRGRAVGGSGRLPSDSGRLHDKYGYEEDRLNDSDFQTIISDPTSYGVMAGKKARLNTSRSKGGALEDDMSDELLFHGAGDRGNIMELGNVGGAGRSDAKGREKLGV